MRVVRCIAVLAVLLVLGLATFGVAHATVHDRPEGTCAVCHVVHGARAEPPGPAVWVVSDWRLASWSVLVVGRAPGVVLHPRSRGPPLS